MPRPPVRKTRRLAKAAEQGKLEAQEKFRLDHAIDVFKLDMPKEQKKLLASVCSHIGKFIDRLTVEDGIKLSAVLGITYIIKPIIQTAPQLVSKASAITELFTLEGMMKPFIALWSGPEALVKFAAGTARPWVEKNMLSEPAAWLLSFCVASIIVIFGPSVLQSMGGIVQVAGLLLAV